MHILLIHQAFAAIDEPGGTRHHELARYLAAQGHRVSIIASPVSYLTGKHEKQGNVVHDADGRITIYRTYTYSALHKSFFHRILSFFSFMVSSFFKSLSIRNVDVVWGTSPPIFQAFTAWLVARLKRKPFLLEIRDLWPAFAIAVGVLNNKILIGLSLWLERFLYKHADQLIVNSPGFIQHIQAKGGRNIRLIPNGADPAFFQTESRSGDKPVYPSWEGKFVVLYTGAHGMSNDLQVVLQAANLLKEHKQIYFALLGAGKEKANLIRKAQDLGLSNLEFLDPLPKTEMPAVISQADACLAILKPIEMYKTTYPNKVFDYMAAGKPIILAIDGVIREVVEKANCGIFCPPGDAQKLSEAVLLLYNNKEQAIEKGIRGQDYLKKHFNRAEIAEEFLDVVKKNVGKSYGRKNIDR
jgi:glycosyltransferase involved in cell wall biosynthesis